MITQHTLDDTLIGTIVGPADGYITKFELVTSQSPVWQADGWQSLPYPNGTFARGASSCFETATVRASASSCSIPRTQPRLFSTALRFVFTAACF
jgi:hypothetical protein